MKQEKVSATIVLISVILAVLCLFARLYTVVEANIGRTHYTGMMGISGSSVEQDIMAEVYGWISIAAAFALVVGILLVNRSEKMLLIYSGIEIVAEVYSYILYFIIDPTEEQHAAYYSLLGDDITPLRFVTTLSAIGVMLCIVFRERIKKLLYAFFIALCGGVYMMFDGLLLRIMYMYDTDTLLVQQEIYESIGIDYLIDFAAQKSGLIDSIIKYVAMKLMPLAACILLGAFMRKKETWKGVNK